MCGLFRKKIPIHEPIEQQIEDVKKYYPMLADKILNGLNCDSLPGAKGTFGSITNPIPVNSAIGQIKYLGKLRGKTGQAVFFHRLHSCKSEVSESLVDMYELVCLDGTQWSILYLDLYHPRRSNMSPPGFTLMPYNEKIKMDIPFAFGVDYFVDNFPYGLPEELKKLGRDAFSRRAQDRLNKHKFENPNLKVTENLKDFKHELSDTQSKADSPRLSLSDILHYEFMSGVINEILEFEKQEIPKIKSHFGRFNYQVLTEKNSHVHSWLLENGNRVLKNNEYPNDSIITVSTTTKNSNAGEETFKEFNFPFINTQDPDSTRYFEITIAEGEIYKLILSTGMRIQKID